MQAQTTRDTSYMDFGAYACVTTDTSSIKYAITVDGVTPSNYDSTSIFDQFVQDVRYGTPIIDKAQHGLGKGISDGISKILPYVLILFIGLIVTVAILSS